MTRHGDTLFVSQWQEVVVVPVDGGDATPVVTDLQSPRGLLVVGDALYIADSGNNRVISVPLPVPGSDPVSGDDAEVIAGEGIDSPRGLAVSGGTLFIADRHNDRVVTVPLAGGTPAVFKGFGEEIGYLASSGETIYIAAMDGTVWSMPVDGGPETEPDEFVTGLSGIRGLATDGETLYMGEVGYFDADDRVRAAPLDGGELWTVADVHGINDVAIPVVEEPGGAFPLLPLLGSLEPGGVGVRFRKSGAEWARTVRQEAGLWELSVQVGAGSVPVTMLNVRGMRPRRSCWPVTILMA